MKRLFALIVTLAVTAVPISLADPVATAEETTHDNVLVAYFSRAGENYNVGVVERGNTDLLAEIVADEANCNSFRIETVKEYPSVYSEMLTVATEERTNKERPELKAEIDSFDSYDVVFVGYPIWWGDMPMAMYSFLESYDWSDKTIIPFNTHEGSGQANTVNTIKEICTGADVLSGFSVQGSVAQNDGESARAIVQNWLNSNQYESLTEKKTVTYTLQDIRNLQDFLLTRPTEENLVGKPYDLNEDERWDVFDLCLMKRAYLQNKQDVDAVSSATITSDEKAVLEAFERFQQAMIDKDMDTLEAIIKDNTIFTHMSGKQQTKAEYLEEIRNGTLNYFKSVIHDPEISVDGETAHLTAVTTLTAKVYGISGSWDLNTNAYFEKIDGEWIYCNSPEDK